MDKEEWERKIIEQYQQDEQSMILVFAQWCVNNDLDARAVYNRAYPGQKENKFLLTAMEQTIPKEEADPIADETLLQVLGLFGNDDLAFAAMQLMEEQKIKNKKTEG